MRLAVLFIILASPLAAWEFRATPLCTVSHETPSVDLTMTYDHGTGLYRIALTRPSPWPPGAVFRIRFDGTRRLMIATDRQVIEDQGRTVAASDTGFGNVLNGLEFNAIATPSLGGAGVAISLEGAAPVIREFRDCVEAVPTT